MPQPNFETMDHAIVAGMVWGLAAKHGLTLVPEVDDEGNYTPRQEVISPDLPPNMHIFITVGAPEPKQWDR